jgi:hypothetical protein
MISRCCFCTQQGCDNIHPTKAKKKFAAAMFIKPLPSSPLACLSQRWRVDCCPLLWWGPPCYTWAGKIPPQLGCVPIPIPVQERLIKQQHTQNAQNKHIYSLVFSSLSLNRHSFLSSPVW